MTVSPFGLYLHVPFCDGKCPYCDFYSRPADEEMMDAYAAAVKRTLLSYRSHTDRPVSSLYLGGGTPSLLGGQAPVRSAFVDPAHLSGAAGGGNYAGGQSHPRFVGGSGRGSGGRGESRFHRAAIGQ